MTNTGAPTYDVTITDDDGTEREAFYGAHFVDQEGPVLRAVWQHEDGGVDTAETVHLAAGWRASVRRNRPA